MLPEGTANTSLAGCARSSRFSYHILDSANIFAFVNRISFSEQNGDCEDLQGINTPSANQWHQFSVLVVRFSVPEIGTPDRPSGRHYYIQPSSTQLHRSAEYDANVGFKNTFAKLEGVTEFISFHSPHSFSRAHLRHCSLFFSNLLQLQVLVSL